MQYPRIKGSLKVRPALLGLAGPLFVIYLRGSVWFVLVAIGIIEETTDDGQSIGAIAGLLAALAFGVISLSAWAILRVRQWSRPLLLWLPVPLALIVSVLEYRVYGTVGGVFLAYLPTYVLWVLLLYWYLYRKSNVVEYFKQRGERGAT